ncbi:hypothetical protein, partial [Rhizobium johnstonii]|uniref:hypothetical protein n=1 Tax=Rhizobium johnstonii TaxID=3019933 RepID=UPI003F9A6DAF
MNLRTMRRLPCCQYFLADRSFDRSAQAENKAIRAGDKAGADPVLSLLCEIPDAQPHFGFLFLRMSSPRPAKVCSGF